MLRRDLSLAIEISDSARNFQDAIVGAGAQVQFVHCYANQVLRILSEFAVLLKLARGHASIAIYVCVAAKPLLLTLSRANNALTDRGGRLFNALAGDVSILDGWHFNVQIDTVQQRPGDALSITLHLGGTATALAFEIAKVAAWTRIHRGDKHEL